VATLINNRRRFICTEIDSIEST